MGQVPACGVKERHPVDVVYAAADCVGGTPAEPPDSRQPEASGSDERLSTRHAARQAPRR